MIGITLIDHIKIERLWCRSFLHIFLGLFIGTIHSNRSFWMGFIFFFDKE